MARAEFSPDAARLMRDVFSGGCGDAALLERVRRRAEDWDGAFALLLARHGPMVLGVCRRTLRDPEDVSDAFQSTFLVLLRRIDAVRVDDSLGRWLYGVARRVAARAKARSARRAAREGGRTTVEPFLVRSPEEDGRRELLAAVDEEIERLPEPFRSVVTLCDVEGLPHRVAADRLGCAVGTVESRLSRGRRRLRDRLARRGFAPEAFVPAFLAPAGLPAALSRSTLKIAVETGGTSAAVSRLVQETLAEATLMKIKGFMAAALVGAVGFGLAAAAAQDRRGRPEAPRAGAAAPARVAPPHRAEPGDLILVEVLEALPGRPITGERLVRPDGTMSLGFYGDLSVVGLTRDEIKVKVIEQLRKYLNDDALGLRIATEDLGDGGDPKKITLVPPVDSRRVFVDDGVGLDPRRLRADEHAKNVESLLSRILAAVRSPDAAPGRNPAPPASVPSGEQERRLDAIEKKLDRLIEAVERRGAR